MLTSGVLFAGKSGDKDAERYEEEAVSSHLSDRKRKEFY